LACSIHNVDQREGATANQELRTQIAKRDSDLSRLRDQREQQAAELNERKHKDSVKLTSLQELKQLAEARSVSFS
jgi:E3 ubiquitin-protein ligase BRE1